ncbi:MAG TPA: DUF805 domain-containing protein [Caldimonas sp.]
MMTASDRPHEATPLETRRQRWERNTDSHHRRRWWPTSPAKAPSSPSASGPPTGRIGRLRFLAYGLAIYVLFVIGSVLYWLGAPLPGHDSVVVAAVGILGFLVYAVAEITLVIQRCHDMDLSGWWSVAALIPLVGLVWVSKGGTRGINRWGAPPPPNGVAVRIFGLLLPIVVIAGIVAAIALPAYQQHSARANAGQPR